MLDKSKLLNKRESARELKHVMNLMDDRDQWMNEHRELLEKAKLKENKRRATLQGRKEEKRKIEQEEGKRLADKAKAGERLTGLARLGAYRRRKEEAMLMLEEEKEKAAFKDSNGKPAKRLSAVLLKQADPLGWTGADSSDAECISRGSSVSSEKEAQTAGRPKLSVAFADETDDLESGNLNTSIMADGDVNNQSVANHSFLRPALPKGYIKADSLRAMKEVCRMQVQHARNMQTMMDQQNKVLKVRLTFGLMRYLWSIKKSSMRHLT